MARGPDTPESARIPQLTLCELAQALAKGALGPREVAAAYLAAIAERDPELLAFVPEPDRGTRIHQELEELEARFEGSSARPPLFGVPVAVKDIFRVDGTPTRAGSALPPELFGGRESELVQRLRGAGAIVLGKTVTAEFALFDPGATHNPRARGHTPGGSSSGSAAAVAAGLAALAIGSQTSGSVIRPAAFCGVVGFKPSFDRLPTAGMLPAAPSLDHAGLLCADASDLQLAASALLSDWRSVEPPPDPPVFGVPGGAYLERLSAADRRDFEQRVERLDRGGFSVRQIDVLADFDQLLERHQRLVAFEFAREHDAWYRSFGGLYRPQASHVIELGRAIPERERDAGRRSQAELRTRLDEAMRAHGLDAWLCPAAPGPAPEGRARTGDPAMNVPFTHAGVPALALPAGTTAAGLPLGLQLAAGFGDDERLVAMAAAFREPIAAALRAEG